MSVKRARCSDSEKRASSSSFSSSTSSTSSTSTSSSSFVFNVTTPILSSIISFLDVKDNEWQLVQTVNKQWNKACHESPLVVDVDNMKFAARILSRYYRVHTIILRINRSSSVAERCLNVLHTMAKKQRHLRKFSSHLMYTHKQSKSYMKIVCNDGLKKFVRMCGNAGPCPNKTALCKRCMHKYCIDRNTTAVATMYYTRCNCNFVERGMYQCKDCKDCLTRCVGCTKNIPFRR